MWGNNQLVSTVYLISSKCRLFLRNLQVKTATAQNVHTCKHTHSQQPRSPPVGRKRYCRAKSPLSQWFRKQSPLILSSLHDKTPQSQESSAPWVDLNKRQKRISHIISLFVKYGKTNITFGFCFVFVSPSYWLKATFCKASWKLHSLFRFVTILLKHLEFRNMWKNIWK